MPAASCGGAARMRRAEFEQLRGGAEPADVAEPESGRALDRQRGDTLRLGWPVVHGPTDAFDQPIRAQRTRSANESTRRT